MAGADYYSCSNCGGKTFYDADSVYDKVETPDGLRWFLCGAHEMEVLCEKCAKTHKVIVVKREG